MIVYLAYPGAGIPEGLFATGTQNPSETPLPQPLAIALDPALWARPGPRLPAGIAQLCRDLRTTMAHNQ